MQTDSVTHCRKDTMAEKRQYTLMLHLSESIGHVRVEDPTILNPQIVKGAGQLLSDYLEDALEALGVDILDETFREAMIELLYKLIYHEFSSLRLLPGWEEVFKRDVGTRRRGPSGRDAYKQWLYGEEDTTDYSPRTESKGEDDNV
jgi:hypothetical protein